MFRGNRQDHAFYAKKAGGAAVSTASPQALWQVVCGLGGPERYYTLNLDVYKRQVQTCNSTRAELDLAQQTAALPQ